MIKPKLNLDNYKDLCSLDYEVIDTFKSNLYDSLEKNMIDALKKRCLTKFKNKSELIDFIEVHCKCVDNIYLKERTYFVDDVPFFIHHYKSEIDIKTIKKDGDVTISATLGSFSAL